MRFRRSYSGAAGLLLTLACGPRVEIGHGDAAGAAGEPGTGATGATTSSGGSPDADGGEGAVSGSGGTNRGGTSPVGGPIPADNGPQAEVSKVDLLIALDNSISMGEKQKLLASAMPELITRLVSPHCVAANGSVVERPASPDAACPAGSEREFEPLLDLHIGVITSSLGSHGATGTKDVCAPAGFPGKDDRAHLLPFVRPGLSSYDGQGYLKWDPDALSDPPGENDAQALAQSLQTMLEAAGETGCGYEAQLESVYRFLVDPAPPQSVQRLIDEDTGTMSGVAEKVGTDAALLGQRANFLRPDSSVVVLMLTDENDCSIVDEGYGWLINRAAPMYRSTSACHTDPSDPCCQSCGEPKANAGCPSLAEDSECAKGAFLDALTGEDELNLRCYKQKERFGFDMLYPIQRYVSGFGDGTVVDRQGQLVENPLFHQAGGARDRSLFTLVVLGGVPWQDLATEASLTSESLTYLSAQQLQAADRWPVMLGDPQSFVEPTDPFMQESTAERSGKNPFTGEEPVSSSSDDPEANSINGHEQVTANRDLQYACTFQLPEPIVCDDQAFQNDVGCDCFADDLAFNRPVCSPPGGGPAGTTQYYGKAYPALRELAVARELGRRSVLGSVCARNTEDDTRSDYGYRPLFDSLVRRVAATLVKP
jgi:hypothetical protein